MTETAQETIAKIPTARTANEGVGALGRAVAQRHNHVCKCGDRWKCGAPAACKLPQREPCFKCWAGTK